MYIDELRYNISCKSGAAFFICSGKNVLGAVAHRDNSVRVAPTASKEADVAIMHLNVVNLLLGGSFCIFIFLVLQTGMRRSLHTCLLHLLILFQLILLIFPLDVI